MGCCSGFARFLLIIFNLVFWLCGVALLAVGIWILVDPDIDDYQEILEDASSDGNFLSVAAYILIGFGALILLVGFCGCCGAIRKSKCLLGFYIFFLVIVFAGELAAVIYVVVNKDSVEDDLEDGLAKSIKEHYVKSLSKPWDAVQKEFKCCGGEGPDDYKTLAAAIGGEVPKSCCVTKDGVPVDLLSCQNKTSDYYKSGCKDSLLDWMEEDGYIIIGVGAGIAFLQIIIFICAVCFCRNMDQDKMD